MDYKSVIVQSGRNTYHAHSGIVIPVLLHRGSIRMIMMKHTKHSIYRYCSKGGYGDG